MNALHGIWLIYLPLMLGGGIVFGVSGFHVRRGSLAARRVAQANAIVGYLLIVAYLASCYRIVDALGRPPELRPEPLSTALMWFSLIGNGLIAAAFPTGLLYIFSRPRNQSAAMSPKPAEPA